MNMQARDKLILELTAERNELNHKAGELERRAALLSTSNEKAGLEAQARGFRSDAREVNRRLDELKDSAIHDDDRGGIER
jgi:hypothetical protein